MRLLATTLALIVGVSPAFAAGLSGAYIEARTCDIWTGPCYANAEMNLAGKNAVLGWKIETGSQGDVNLEGLSVVAVVGASDTLGQKQTGKARAVLIVDERATERQKAALVRFAQKQGGELTANVVKIETSRIELDLCPCKENGCAKLDAGLAKIETRCLNARHDKVCGNESAFYPALTRDVKVTPALAVEHSFTGSGAGARWSDAGRRGAYVGTFTVR
ncbi:MAG: DUF1326 domain-containing protein [Gemmataceae bacterium]